MLASEMTAYDPTSGELRTHYAGFFDPGFGYDPDGIVQRVTRRARSARARRAVHDRARPARLQAHVRAHARRADAVLRQASASNYQGQQDDAQQALPAAAASRSRSALAAAWRLPGSAQPRLGLTRSLFSCQGTDEEVRSRSRSGGPGADSFECAVELLGIDEDRMAVQRQNVVDAGHFGKTTEFVSVHDPEPVGAVRVTQQEPRAVRCEVVMMVGATADTHRREVARVVGTTPRLRPEVMNLQTVATVARETDSARRAATPPGAPEPAVTVRHDHGQPRRRAHRQAPAGSSRKLGASRSFRPATGRRCSSAGPSIGTCTANNGHGCSSACSSA